MSPKYTIGLTFFVIGVVKMIKLLNEMNFYGIIPV